MLFDRAIAIKSPKKKCVKASYFVAITLSFRNFIFNSLIDFIDRKSGIFESEIVAIGFNFILLKNSIFFYIELIGKIKSRIKWNVLYKKHI